MATNHYQLASTSATTSNGATYIDLPQSGHITSVSWDVCGSTSGSGGGSVRAAVSLVPSDQGTTNGARGEISGASFGIAAASQYGAANKADVGMAFPVRIGQRLYLNLTVAGYITTANTRVTVVINS